MVAPCMAQFAHFRFSVTTMMVPSDDSVMSCFMFQNHTRMWVSASPRPARASPRVGVAERSSPAPAPALVTGVRLISARLPSSPPQQIPAKTAHQLYPRVPGRTVS